MPASAARASAGSRRRRSRADDPQDLVAPALHVLLRDERLEAQPQQRLGVRRAHVEVPVVVVDRDAVEVADRARRRSAASISAIFAGASSTVELISPEMKYVERYAAEQLGQLAPSTLSSSRMSSAGIVPLSAQ